MKRKRYRLKKTVIAKFIIFMGLLGAFFSSYNIIKWKMNVAENAAIKKEVDTVIKEIDDEDLGRTEYEIDFASLKERNGDTVAYIRVYGTKIDYVVVKADDNSYYLNHNFDKKYNSVGWIFADYHNKFDETDRNIVMYGHNTKDGSMFGTLKYILKKEWYTNRNNYKVILVTENGTYHYEIFSTYSIDPEDYYINTSFKNDEEFGEFVKTLKKRSVYNFGTEVDSKDKILTLSSCIDSGQKRVVLHAKLVELVEDN